MSGPSIWRYLDNIYTLIGRPGSRRRCEGGHGARDRASRGPSGQRPTARSGEALQQVHAAKLAAEMPGFDWSGLGAAQNGLATPRSSSAQPSFFKGFAALCRQRAARDWKAGWRAAVSRRSAVLSKPFVDAHFEFFERRSADSRRRPRAKRGVTFVNGVARRGGRPDDVGEALPAGGEGADGEDRRPTCSRRTARRSRTARVDDARDAEAGARQAREVHAEDWLPGKWRDYSA